MPNYSISTGVEQGTGLPLRTYTITDAATSSPTFTVSVTPYNPNYSIVVKNNSFTIPNGSFIPSGQNGGKGLFTLNSNPNWHSGQGTTVGDFFLDYQDMSSGTSIIPNATHIHFNFNDY